jgi:hypothetical protein
MPSRCVNLQGQIRITHKGSVFFKFMQFTIIIEDLNFGRTISLHGRVSHIRTPHYMQIHEATPTLYLECRNTDCQFFVGPN